MSDESDKDVTYTNAEDIPEGYSIPIFDENRRNDKEYMLQISVLLENILKGLLQAYDNKKHCQLVVKDNKYIKFIGCKQFDDEITFLLTIDRYLKYCGIEYDRSMNIKSIAKYTTAIYNITLFIHMCLMRDQIDDKVSEIIHYMKKQLSYNKDPRFIFDDINDWYGTPTPEMKEESIKLYYQTKTVDAFSTYSDIYKSNTKSYLDAVMSSTNVDNIPPIPYNVIRYIDTAGKTFLRRLLPRIMVNEHIVPQKMQLIPVPQQTVPPIYHPRVEHTSGRDIRRMENAAFIPLYNDHGTIYTVLVQEAKGIYKDKWSTIGGKCDYGIRHGQGERNWKCIKREHEEEVNIPMPITNTIYAFNNSAYNTKVFYGYITQNEYLQYIAKEGQHNISNEIRQLKTVPLNNIYNGSFSDIRNCVYKSFLLGKDKLYDLQP